ncbi:two-component system sensor histidine kinase NtrB [Pseudopontixanthobacter vadosimaris]|uniref:two-component system sensor histidine kinase NtrB n=1 Tax=Pseudopontixanthobacter vadosimaris TaxID=2726450 RepID=UPI0030B8BC40
MRPQCGADERQQPDAASQIAGMRYAIILLSPDLTLAELNPAAEELLGQGAARLLGQPLHRAIIFADNAVRRRIENGDFSLTARDIAVTIGSATLTVNLTLSPLPAANGWKVLTLSESGSQHGSISRELRDAHIPYLQRGPSILAHEIKNPLAAIRGAGQLLARRLAAEDRALTDLISDEVARIARLVDRMQALGSDRREPVTGFNMHLPIRSALNAIRSTGPGHLPIVEEFDPSLPDVFASRDALQQIIINLVTNALHACADAREPRVTVRTRFASGISRQSLGSGSPVSLPLEIIIADNGPGVAEMIFDQMFDPFVTTKAGGQGLGLALVRKLLNDMDGRIAYIRDTRAGISTFRVNLPVAS